MLSDLIQLQAALNKVKMSYGKSRDECKAEEPKSLEKHVVISDVKGNRDDEENVSDLHKKRNRIA